MADEPIEPQDYVGGVTVVDIGDLRVARGLTRRPASSCRHLRLHYDPRERRIWCADCEKDIDPFDAFVNLVGFFDEAYKSLKQGEKELAEAKSYECRSIAAKNIDGIWRGRHMVPACPYCGEGLLPEDFQKIGTTLGREYARARRQKLKNK